MIDCGCDGTGRSDTTARLQACIDRAYTAWGFSLPRVPVFLPAGVYAVSDTLVLAQKNPGPDDGINVVPGRFLPHILIGEPVSSSGGGSRPVLRLLPSSPGFGGASGYKPLVKIYSSGGEGVDMNNLFKGIDVDLTAPGNPAAAGISHPGAQGATVTDVAVRAAAGAFSCFCGLNGAGGMHSNVYCEGARYGLYIDDSQPVPSAAGVTLVNQSISAVFFFGQETLSLVGANIVLPPWASGPAIATSTQGMSLVDVAITCGASSQTAISTSRSLAARSLFVRGCGTAIAQEGAPPVPGPPLGGAQWLAISQFARGIDVSPYYVSSAVYLAGVRQQGAAATVLQEAVLPAGEGPSSTLVSQHVWDEASFPDKGTPGVADASADCGAVGDGVTDSTASLQACLSAHGAVFLPPGLYRISATLQLSPGGSLVGMGNAASLLLAASAGFAGGTAESPAPLLRTAEGGGAIIVAHVGLVTWQHLAGVSTLDWRSQNPLSVWRVNFESRNCECLWLSAWQALDPPAVACKPPVNFTSAKTRVAGLGRFYSFVNDDTGSILSTGAAYRSLLVADTAAFAGTEARTRFYSLNLEHAQSESNGEVRNASFVDIYSIKGEGNTPLLWLRGDVRNVSVLGLGGGITPFAFNFTQPPDFAQRSASLFRVDVGARGVVFAALLDHGYGASPPYWPPKGGGCMWGRHYPYPGTAVPFYPFSTFPNVTMWK